MGQQNMLKRTTKDRVLNSVAAGTTVQKAAGVDMSAHSNVVFDVGFGAITATAVTSIKLQHSADDVDGNYVDVLGSNIAVPDTASNKMYSIEAVRPQKQWVRVVITRGTANAVIDGVFATRGNPRRVPTTHGTTVGATNVLIEPASGTP